MDNTHDVIIVGAGVAGLMLARLLDDTALRVLLLEQKPEIKVEPDSFGTFTEAAREHGLEDFIVQYFDTWAFYGPTTKAAKTRKKVMCLVDYQKWASELTLKRVQVETGVTLEGAWREEGGIVLAAGTNRHHGRLVVDASGFAQIVRRLLGLKLREKTGLSYEVELKGCRIPVRDEASFILDFRVTNSGGWLYVLGNDRAQFGWADFWPESGSNLADLEGRVLGSMRRIGPQRDWLADAEVVYSYGRFGPTGGLAHSVHDNLLSIGDAGGFGTPVTLEGFREALDSARMAFLTITEADEFSEDRLRPFLHRFHARHGKYYRMHEIVRFVFLHWVRNADIDLWITNFAKLDEEDFFRVIRGELTVSLMWKTLKGALVKQLLLNGLNSVLPRPLRFRERITASKKETINAGG